MGGRGSCRAYDAMVRQEPHPPNSKMIAAGREPSGVCPKHTYPIASRYPSSRSWSKIGSVLCVLSSTITVPLSTSTKKSDLKHERPRDLVADCRFPSSDGGPATGGRRKCLRFVLKCPRGLYCLDRRSDRHRRCTSTRIHSIAIGS